MDLLKPFAKRYPSPIELDDLLVQSSCIYDDVDKAVESCVEAQKMFVTLPKATRLAITDDIRATTRELAEDFAWWAVCETKRGCYKDKVAKQFLAANKTPGCEDLETKAMVGDLGMTLTVYEPYGVLVSITPVTNPTATVVHNVICLISAGNGVIFNAHPAAMRCTNRAVAIFNEIIKKHGGPDSLICAMRVPTIPSAQQLLKHPKISANVVTGGPAVVKTALNSGKKCFCAGPGNPPVVVDETADIPMAARSIYMGAQFDNNMICSDEKEVFVVESVADRLFTEMLAVGAYKLSSEEVAMFEKLCLKEPVPDFTHGVINAEIAGISPQALMEKIGQKVDPECRLLICDVREGHPFVHTELLCPILPIVTMKNFETAVEAALKAEHGYRHTSSLYSQDVSRITYMSKKCNTSLFTVNGNHLSGLASGGEGYTAFTIAGYTGEGMTRPRTFSREKRIVHCGALN